MWPFISVNDNVLAIEFFFKYMSNMHVYAYVAKHPSFDRHGRFRHLQIVIQQWSLGPWSELITLVSNCFDPTRTADDRHIRFMCLETWKS